MQKTTFINPLNRPESYNGLNQELTSGWKIIDAKPVGTVLFIILEPSDGTTQQKVTYLNNSAEIANYTALNAELNGGWKIVRLIPYGVDNFVIIVLEK